MKLALTATILMLAPLRASADMPPTELLSARITVSSDATVSNFPPFGKWQKTQAPSRTMDVYVWRERGDAPVTVTSTTPPRALSSRGLEEFSFTLAQDMFEITNPRSLIIFTGSGQMGISSTKIIGVEPFNGPLNGKQTYHILPVSVRDAKLLRQGPPSYSCSLGRENSTERVLMSWGRRNANKEFAVHCGESDKPQKASKIEIEKLSKMKNVVVLEITEDDC